MSLKTRSYKLLCHLYRITLENQRRKEHQRQQDSLQRPRCESLESRLMMSTVYVDVNAGGADSGGDWANAYTDLQAGLAAAVSGDEIWIADGTYTPGAARAAAFEMKTGVALYGGFEGASHSGGGETSLGQRDGTHETILSGDIGTLNDNSDNSFNVVVASGVNSVVLDGVTISDGNANRGSYGDLPSWIEQHGGGMHLYLSDVSLNDVRVEDNSTNNRAGGIFVGNSSTITISDATFTRNHAVDSGGGMYVRLGNAKLVNVAFNGNTTNGDGGGMACDQTTTLWGGGAGDGGVSLTNVSFTGNTATRWGGGLYNFMASTTINNVTMTANTAAFGGGMMNQEDSDATVNNSIIWGNTATTSGDNIWCSEDFVLGTSEVTFTNCDIEGAFNAGSWVADTDFSDDSGSTNVDGGGNIDVDPTFVTAPDAGGDSTWGTNDDNYGDLQLQAGSDAIDAGSDALLPADILDIDGDGNTAEDIPLDLAGERRVDDGTVDMGAYEYLTNADPTNSGTLPTDITVTEDVAGNVDLSDIDLADEDAGTGALTLMLTALSGGNLTASSGGGVTVSNSGTARITLTGTLADLNTFLDNTSNIRYLHGTANTNGEDAGSIRVQVSDNGNSGAGGGGWIDFGTVNVDISAVNDAPTSTGTLPTSITIDEDVAGGVNFGNINLADVDAANITVTVSTGSGGLLMAGSSAGVTVGGSGTSSLTLAGSVGNINVFLGTASNVEYLNSSTISDYSDTILVSVTDGAGGSINLGSMNVSITETPVLVDSNAPVISLVWQEVIENISLSDAMLTESQIELSEVLQSIVGGELFLGNIIIYDWEGESTSPPSKSSPSATVTDGATLKPTVIGNVLKPNIERGSDGNMWTRNPNKDKVEVPGKLVKDVPVTTPRKNKDSADTPEEDGTGPADTTPAEPAPDGPPKANTETPPEEGT